MNLSEGQIGHVFYRNVTMSEWFSWLFCVGLHGSAIGARC